MDGLQGLIIIEDPDDPDELALKEMYDEERVLFLQDWYHKSGSSLRNSKFVIFLYAMASFTCLV
jgi:FtsP/CotA-like multicopper oxidase with cupredoxin domain